MSPKSTPFDQQAAHSEKGDPHSQCTSTSNMHVHLLHYCTPPSIWGPRDYSHHIYRVLKPEKEYVLQPRTCAFTQAFCRPEQSFCVVLHMCAAAQWKVRDSSKILLRMWQP
jgi:hypothetical protein